MEPRGSPWASSSVSPLRVRETPGAQAARRPPGSLNTSHCFTERSDTAVQPSPSSPRTPPQRTGQCPALTLHRIRATVQPRSHARLHVFKTLERAHGLFPLSTSTRSAQRAQLWAEGLWSQSDSVSVMSLESQSSRGGCSLVLSHFRAGQTEAGGASCVHCASWPPALGLCVSCPLSDLPLWMSASRWAVPGGAILPGTLLAAW